VNAKKVRATIVILLVLSVNPMAWAKSVRASLQQGNKLYAEGNFNDAIKKYDQALTDAPQALEPKFNKANGYFQLDDLVKAIDLYREVSADSKDMKLVAKAKYNLGNCYFKQGSKQIDSNLHKALEDLQTAIAYWRQTLDIDPENEKAAKNIEVARLTIKDIIDRINKQKKEQQQQAEKQKKLQKQLKELLEHQKALAQKTQQVKNDTDKGQISRQEAEDNYKKQAQEQSQLEDKTEQALQQIQQQDPNIPQPPHMKQAGSELEQAADAQSDAETQLKASDGSAAKQSQDKAAKHLENTLKALSQDNQQKQGQQQEQQGQEQQPQEPNQPDKKQQQQQKEQKAAAAQDTTAQEILDKEQKKKKQRQILQRGGYQRVEKDW